MWTPTLNWDWNQSSLQFLSFSSRPWRHKLGSLYINLSLSMTSPPRWSHTNHHDAASAKNRYSVQKWVERKMPTQGRDPFVLLSYLMFYPNQNVKPKDPDSDFESSFYWHSRNVLCACSWILASLLAAVTVNCNSRLVLNKSYHRL